ncbi:MAG: HdeD family acid-resistance protein [Candidatus Eiseniibacteriota bacterium]
MLAFLAKRWWVLLLRGIAAVLFGFLAIAWPDIALYSFVLLFGFYAIVDGVSALVLGFRGSKDGGMWWQMILIGLAGIAAGIISFVQPGITAVALVFVIAFWSIVRGVFEIAAAIRLRKMIEHEWLLGLSGALSIAFGVLLFLRPGAGALALVLLIGAFMIALGFVSIMLSFRVKALKPTGA